MRRGERRAANRKEDGIKNTSSSATGLHSYQVPAGSSLYGGRVTTRYRMSGTIASSEIAFIGKLLQGLQSLAVQRNLLTSFNDLTTLSANQFF